MTDFRRHGSRFVELRPELSVRGSVNDLDDRAAMGLPRTFVEPAFDQLEASYEQLGCRDRKSLAQLVEDRGMPAEERLAAGHLLALRGDPRIDPLDPVMVEVSGGNATIGTPAEDVARLHAEYERYGVQESWIAKEAPRWSTTVAGFRLARYPVTNVEYARFLSETDFEQLPSSWPCGRPPLACDNHPVYTVSAEAADAYARWLSARTGRRFRLPHEWEWEYAAAGPGGRRFPWGENFQELHANTMEAGLLMTSPVGCFPHGESWCGALDMAGNVEEFVSSVYEPYPAAEIVEDDLWRLLGHYRVARGGAFNRFRDLSRCQRRHGAYPKTLYAIGFRIAEDL